VGKSTLAGMVAQGRRGPVTSFDLESDEDLARLSDPMQALKDLRGLVIMDEMHRRPDLLRVLRVLADRPGTPCRFLVLGSASPELLGQSSETLAGRIVMEWRRFWTMLAHCHGQAWNSSELARSFGVADTTVRSGGIPQGGRFVGGIRDRADLIPLRHSRYAKRAGRPSPCPARCYPRGGPDFRPGSARPRSRPIAAAE